MSGVLSPVRFDAPLVNPSHGGLYSATQWTTVPAGEPARWLADGVDVYPMNYGGGESFGVWAAPWNAAESDLTQDDVKTGVRPERLDPFLPVTLWAADTVDLFLAGETRDQVRVRAAQNLRMNEQVAVELVFAGRLLDDAGTPSSASDLVGALAVFESAFASASTVGFVHASPKWLPLAASMQLVVGSGSVLKTPGGQTWVFGGGYVDGLGEKLVATSQPFGWRTESVVRAADAVDGSRFQAVAERSVLVGYEALVGAVEIGA